jgi:hypothetical protein
MHLLKRRSRGLSAKPAKPGLVNPPPELAKVGATRCGVPDFSASGNQCGKTLEGCCRRQDASARRGDSLFDHAWEDAMSTFQARRDKAALISARTSAVAVRAMARRAKALRAGSQRPAFQMGAKPQ